MADQTATRTATIEPATEPTRNPPVRPVPAAPPVDVTIPDGDPALAALALLAAVRPDAKAALAARIDSIDVELGDAVEAARLGHAALPEFIKRAGRLARLRATLRARAGLPSASPSAEVLALVRSVRRWRPSSELRAERGRIVPRLRGELAQVEADIRAECAAFARGGGLTLGGGEDATRHRRAGLTHEHDEFLRRMEGALKSRASLVDRLARLDPESDSGRAVAARSAIEAAAGVDALVELLAPSLESPAASELARVRRTIGEVSEQIAGTDPESRHAAALSARRDGLEARASELVAAAARERTVAAGSLVAAALSGGLAALEALESAVRPSLPALAAELAALRGDDAALVAVIDELTRPAEDPKGREPWPI